VAHILDPRIAFDPDGREVRLGRLWADRAAVLVFVRHFGCLFCRQQIAEVTPFLDRIRSRGAELVVIGHGTVEEAREFRDEQRLAVPLLTDPSRQSYCALEMRHGLPSVFTPAVLVRSLKALRAGFRQSRIAGDPLQQGGVVVIAPGGVERFRFISRSAGDHPAPRQILRALEEETAAPARPDRVTLP
jgi:peroxiredoxin